MSSTDFSLGSEISIATWNVLADCYAYGSQQSHPDVDSHVLHWDLRWPLIQRALLDSYADIICLQEVDLL